MLEEVLRYINNRFDTDSHGVPYGTASGTFTVSGGKLETDAPLGGQYYWVEGSVLNDGLHLHPDTHMRDEEFDGTIVLLVVPKSVEDMATEIAAWIDEHAEAVDSPYSSESFGGYSYTKAGGGASGAETAPAAWQEHFGARLRPYRKLSRDWV